MAEPTTTSADDTLSTTQTWFGGTGNFSNPQNWSPPGPPANSDTLIIDAGRAIADDLTIANPLIRLGSPTTTPTLVLDDATLAATNTISEQAAMSDTSAPPLSARIGVAGTVIEDGTLIVGSHGFPVFPPLPADLTVDMAKHSTFVMDAGAGWVSQYGSTLTVNAPEHGARFVNNGDIQAFGGTVTMNAPVTGHGTFDTRVDFTKFEAGTVEFKEDVGAGQTIRMGTGFSGAGLLKLDEPKEFHASIVGFLPGSTIELTHTEVTSAKFSNGVLTLFDQHQVEARLNIVGNFTTDQFAISNQGGNAFITPAQPAPVSPQDTSGSSNTANVALLGQYAAASFTTTNDDHGATQITQPPANEPLLLAQPQA